MITAGQIYARREPAGDLFDRLRVVGADSDGLGVTPADGFHAVEPADAGQLLALYTLEADASAEPRDPRGYWGLEEV